MYMTRLLAPTLRDNPAEAEVISHQLLMRAGYIRRLASGIYNYLPLMQRVIKKVENIVREEMDKSGAQELLMPILQPSDIWEESGRWEVYGKELIRLKDRHGRNCVLGPTHEEVITTIAKNELHSYRQLPMNLYQIQNKYRDEIRPRFGLLRGREFIMKDAYSFHSSQNDLEREYDVMADTYTSIFQRCGLETRMVRSDSGAIGGSVSHEFMVLTDTHSGEDNVFYCDSCNYAANSERAESILPTAEIDGSKYFSELKEVETPNCPDLESITKFLGVPGSLIGKSLLYIVDDTEPVLAFVRGDLSVQETKLKNALGANEVRLASAEEVAQYTGTEKGYVGVGNMTSAITDSGQLRFTSADEKYSFRVVLDNSAFEMKNFAIAMNKTGYHQVGFNWPDNAGKAVHDFRLSRIDDTCPECKSGKLLMTRGMEVGNIFQLGTKYSDKMGATFATEDGQEASFIMGCYGIGISRTAAAAVEASHDDNGIIWPVPIAPYHVAVVPVNTKDETQMNLAEGIYSQLISAGIETVLDDRDERAGVKFKDADLLGFPVRVTAGKKAAEGILEVKLRQTGEVLDIAENDVVIFVNRYITQNSQVQDAQLVKEINPAHV